MKTHPIGFAFALMTALLLAPLAATAAKPNVVYRLADDLGWGDLTVNGGSIPTPRIDRLFREGVRLDNFMGWLLAVSRLGSASVHPGSGKRCSVPGDD